MIKLIDIIEYKSDRFNYTAKESPKKTIKTYETLYVIKVKKKYNRNKIYERVRALKDITTVDVVTNPKLEKMSEKSSEYEYNLLSVKFMTPKDPKDKVLEIKDQMLHTDEEKENFKILGIVAVKPQDHSLKKID